MDPGLELLIFIGLAFVAWFVSVIIEVWKMIYDTTTVCTEDDDGNLIAVTVNLREGTGTCRIYRDEED